MPFTIPNMPLECFVWEMVNTNFNDKIFRSSSECQLLPPKRSQFDAYTWNDNDTIGAVSSTLLLPKGRNIRASAQNLNGIADLVQIVGLEAFWWYVNTVYPVAYGYPNQYLVAAITLVGQFQMDNAPLPPGQFP